MRCEQIGRRLPPPGLGLCTSRPGCGRPPAVVAAAIRQWIGRQREENATGDVETQRKAEKEILREAGGLTASRARRSPVVVLSRQSDSAAASIVATAARSATLSTTGQRLAAAAAARQRPNKCGTCKHRWGRMLCGSGCGGAEQERGGEKRRGGRKVAVEERRQSREDRESGVGGKRREDRAGEKTEQQSREDREGEERGGESEGE